MQIKNNEKTTFNIKIDKKIRAEAQKVAKELGIPLGTLLNASLRHLVRTKTMTFSLLPVQSKKMHKNNKA